MNTKNIGRIGRIILLFYTLALTSCGKDDSGVEQTLKNAVFEYAYNLGIANAGGFIKTPEVSIPLDELLNGYTYIPPIRSGQLSLTDITSIKVSSANQGIVLKDFILTVNGVNIKTGNLVVDNNELYNQETLNLVINLFNSMVNQNKLIISTSFTPSRKIVDEDELKIVFRIKADYTYRQ